MLGAATVEHHELEREDQDGHRQMFRHSPVRWLSLFNGLHLLPPAEHEAADDDKDQRRDEPDPYSKAPGGLLREAKDQAP